MQLGEKLVSLGQSTFGVRLDSRSSGPGVTRKLPPPDWLGVTGNPFIRTKTLFLLSQRIQVCFFFLFLSISFTGMFIVGGRASFVPPSSAS